MVTSRLLLVTALFVSAPFAAFAASGATVGVKIAELRIKPDDQAFSRLKIPGGREVAVLGKSDDGRWIKVRTQIEKGEETIKLEGWLEASQLKGADTASLSVASGGASSNSNASSDSFGSSSSDSSSEWGDTAAAEPAPAASSSPAWESTSAPAASAEPDMGSWDLSDSGSSESAEPTPAPAGGDEWESSSSSDSTSSDSSSDGW